MPSTVQPTTLDTEAVPARERPSLWAHWIDRLFGGLKSDLYGDDRFDGRMTTVHAGDVVLTRLEANRHRVLRSHGQGRASDHGYLKIVAPYVGCAGVEQQGREAWVTPGQWSIYDTTDAYAVANPQKVEHLIVMLPRQRLVEGGLSLNPLMARRLGGTGGVARMALETMRSAHRELPGMSQSAASGVGNAITEFVRLAMLDLAGIGNAPTHLEALRERIKQHVAQHLGDPDLTVDAVARALNCSRRQLYNAFAEEPDGVAGYIQLRRIQACRQAFDDRTQDRRSITDIAFAFGFSSMAHFSRVFRGRLGVPPSDYRRRQPGLPKPA